MNTSSRQILRTSRLARGLLLGLALLGPSLSACAPPEDEDVESTNAASTDSSDENAISVPGPPLTVCWEPRSVIHLYNRKWKADPYALSAYNHGCGSWSVEVTTGGLIRGPFAATEEVLNGTKWLKVAPIGVGGYLQHLWVRLTNNPLNCDRLWIYYESLDAKPDAIEDRCFGPTPARNPWLSDRVKL